MNSNSGGKFRKKRTNFSMVSNDIIRNDNVSLKAKGLYALIQSYITLENFTLYKGFLQSKCIEGERAFDSAWRELKEKGYLVQYKLKDENNKYYYEYELLDEPKPPPQNVGEVLNMPDNATLKINQLDLPVETVKERFRKVHYKHLEYIKLIFQDFTGEISSMKNYMITTIYNAPATCDIYFAHRVNRDQYKDSSHHIA